MLLQWAQPRNWVIGMTVQTYCVDCRESTQHRELMAKQTDRHNFYQCVKCGHVVQAPNMERDQ